MERVAFLLKIKPGVVAEYRRRHDEIWEEMLRALAQSGARNYSIFLAPDEVTLFAYLEATPDFATMVARINTDPVNARWQEYMRDIMVPTVDPGTGWAPRLPELFHMA